MASDKVKLSECSLIYIIVFGVICFLFVSLLLIRRTTSEIKLNSKQNQYIINGENFWENERFKIFIRYRPVEEIIKLESRSKVVDSVYFHTRKRELEGFHYFLIVITCKNNFDLLKSKSMFGESPGSRLLYFQENMIQDVQISDGFDTIDCEMYHFEQSHQLSSDYKINIAFPDKISSNGSTIIINWTRFNCGVIQLHPFEN